MLQKSGLRMCRLRTIRELRGRIERLEREMADLRAKTPVVVYQPVWLTPPAPAWDPLRPYCAPLPPLGPGYWPTVVSSGDAAHAGRAIGLTVPPWPILNTAGGNYQ